MNIEKIIRFILLLTGTFTTLCILLFMYLFVCGGIYKCPAFIGYQMQEYSVMEAPSQEDSTTYTISENISEVTE